MISRSLFLFLLVCISCSKHEDLATYSPANNAPALSPDHKTITFPKQSVGLKQFKIEKVGVKGQFISLIAPSHVVATVNSRKKDSQHVILESSNLNELYYNYAQAVETRKNLERNFSRLKDMAAQQAATIKDLKDGERDLLNSKFAELESINKLKASGLNPEIILKAKPDSAFLVSDLPENQLGHVELKEEVDVYFNSFPDEKFVGNVVDISDVIDPVSRTLKITVMLGNGKGRIKSGMFAKVQFGDFNQNLVSVPVTALITVDGRNYIFVAKDTNVFQLKEVTPMVYGEERVGIGAGMSPEESIVSQGALLLKSLVFGH